MKKQRFIYTKNAVDSDGSNGDYLLIFHHNVTKGDVFTSEKDFLYANKPMKYSLFGFIDDSFKFDGKNFEFLIEYPDDNTHGFWIQNTNPLKAEYDSDIGYSDKGSDFKGDVKFTGLTKYSGVATFLEGCKSSTNEWYYSIGATIPWEKGDSLPGSYYGGDTLFYEVFLWMRVPSFSFARSKLFAFYTCILKARHSFNVSIFAFIFLCS